MPGREEAFNHLTDSDEAVVKTVGNYCVWPFKYILYMAFTVADELDVVVEYDRKTFTQYPRYEDSICVSLALRD